MFETREPGPPGSAGGQAPVCRHQELLVAKEQANDRAADQKGWGMAGLAFSSF